MAVAPSFALPTGTLGGLNGFHDFGSVRDDFRADVLAGLARPQKRIAAKYFYDARGSELFERICDLPEYYPTRTEIALLRRHSAEIAALAGEDAALVEFGSGADVKARLVLDALARPTAYVPIDISREHLIASAQALAGSYPDVAVIPLCADYTRAFDLPAVAKAGRRLGFFPGSTIGNFRPIEAAAFLGRAAVTLGAGSGLLIGVDLKKDSALLQAAYDDAQGVTAAFNKNLLTRINSELGGDIDVESFEHRAFYNDQRGCIEMHLVSRVAQAVTVAGEAFRFAAGESIHTEDSHKYDPEDFRDLAEAGGWQPRRCWVDDERLFSLHYLVAI